MRKERMVGWGGFAILFSQVKRWRDIQSKTNEEVGWHLVPLLPPVIQSGSETAQPAGAWVLPDLWNLPGVLRRWDFNSRWNYHILYKCEDLRSGLAAPCASSHTCGWLCVQRRIVLELGPGADNHMPSVSSAWPLSCQPWISFPTPEQALRNRTFTVSKNIWFYS